MGAGSSKGAVDDEGRDGGDPETGGGTLVVADLVGEAIACEHLTSLVLRDPHLAGQADQSVVVTEELALGEVSAQETLLHRVLEAMVTREVHEPMPVEGGAASRTVEPKLEPLASRGIREVALHLPCPLDGDAVLLGQPRSPIADPLRRCSGIELKASPDDPDIIPMLEPGERSL